jgi:hypothetical protein
VKTTTTLLCFLLSGFVLPACAVAAEAWTLSDEFLAYLKQTTNPHGFGVRKDGRFYPYSSPRGRRIGYDGLVDDKALYQSGLGKEEAEARLRARVEEALRGLVEHAAMAYPERQFRSLSRKSQEMLVDHALSEGARNVPAAFYEAVMDERWDDLFGRFLYIRWVERGWPDTMRNKPFVDRWLVPRQRLPSPE